MATSFVSATRPRPAAGLRSPTEVQRSAEVQRSPVIDRFRGVAILLVILYHVNSMIIFPNGWGLVRGADGAAHVAAGGLWLRLLFLPFHMGRVGVNLFFVISGLCIHMRVARQRAVDPQAPFSLSTFLLRRFFRIYPSYWVALALGALVAPLAYAALSGTGPVAGFGVPSAANLAAHAVMLHSFFKPYIMSIIRPLWSIATEEQFYLLYPLVFVALGRRLRITQIVGGLLLLSAAWRLGFILGNPKPAVFSDGPFLVWVFGFSLPRYFEWSLGALLAWAMANDKTLAMVGGRVARFVGARPRLVTVAGLGLIVAGGASLVSVRLKWMLEDPCYSTGWFLILSAAVLPRAGDQAARASRPVLAGARRVASGFLEGLGRRSFTVYLLHEMALMATVCLMNRYHLPPITVAAPLGCALIALICYPFYELVEAPTEWRSKQVGRRRQPGAVPARPYPAPLIGPPPAGADAPLTASTENPPR